MDYSGFGVIAIKAIQEQQKEIELLKKQLAGKDEILTNLNNRLRDIEMLLTERR